MSSVHSGVDAWAGVLAVDEPAFEAAEVGAAADSLTEAAESEVAAELIEVLGVPDSAGALEQPASAAPVISAKAISALLRIIDLP